VRFMRLRHSRDLGLELRQLWHVSVNVTADFAQEDE